MSENTNIEWCDHTFNPWEGCQHAGPGCDHCYAETRNARFAGGVAINWGPGAPRRRTSIANWRKPLAWNAAHDSFFATHRRRQRVFSASLADVFDNAVDPQWRVDLLELIAKTPNLDWLLLTKRIGNAHAMLDAALDVMSYGLTQWADVPWPNVWIGATIVNQAEADRDIPKLLLVPATKRFLSMEPLLGPVDLSTHRGAKALPLYWEGADKDGLIPRHCGLTGRHLGDFARRRWVKTSENMSPWIDWVIVGGESGPRARPMHQAWPRSLRDQCAAAGVPFLFKQWGEWRPMQLDECKSGNARLVSVDSRPTSAGYHLKHQLESMLTEPRYGWQYPVVKVGKNAAGRTLDGMQHDEYPEGR